MKRIVMIGSGNVATSLAHALRGRCRLVQVYSRRMEHARQLAAAVGADPVDSAAALVTDADAYVVAVADDAIAGIVDASPPTDGLWLHTSGSVPMAVFAGRRSRYGVLYPLQSFSRDLLVDLRRVHFFVEGSSAAVTAQIAAFVRRFLSEKVTVADSRQRCILHLAAVFACNFANHMWTLAADVMSRDGLPFDAMLPLIESTVEKLHHLSPSQSQTGPAARGDEAVMRRHLSMLHGDEEAIYRMLSQSIMNHKARK